MLLSPTNQHSFQYHAHHHTVSIKEMLSSVSTRSDESSTIWSYINSYCWWFRNPANRLIGSWFIPLFTRFYTSQRWFFLGFPCRSPLPIHQRPRRIFATNPWEQQIIWPWAKLSTPSSLLIFHDSPCRCLPEVGANGKFKVSNTGWFTEGYESLHRMYEATYVSNLFMIYVCNVYDVIYIHMFKKMKQSYFLSARTMHAHVCVPRLDNTVQIP